MGRKSKKTKLKVLYEDHLVGMLERSASGEISFTYEKSWITRDGSFPISYSLRIREEAYRGAVVAAFFDNLLPDNEAIRKALAERTTSPSTSCIDLLASIGKDCVGALRFFGEEETVPPFENFEARTLKESEIAGILRNLNRYPLGVGLTREFRISIAGAQDKTALLRGADGGWTLPLNTTPTSHIFKVAMGILPNGIDLTTSVENEWLCTRLARHFKLPVASSDIERFEDVTCLVVERFDRRPGKTSITRLPQEDLCQALGVPAARKYESDGGPGMKTIMQFLDASDTRSQDRSTFMRAQIFFYLIGAIDGHAKNFSILITKSGFVLTPLYDILTVFPALRARQIERGDAKLAMCVGANRHYRLDEIQVRHWEQTAKICGYPLHTLHEDIRDLRSRVDSLNALFADLPADFPRSIAEQTFELILRQSKCLN